ncbi:MAG: EamA family transporter [Kiritimatiellae bacterium]|nr:EamA family transporter [Kiritimatiellia bacterium]
MSVPQPISREPTETEQSPWTGRVLCVVAALLWSTSGLFIKKLTGAGAAWSGWQVAGLRSLIASVTLLLIARPRRVRPTRAQWIVAVLVASTVLPYVLAQTYTATANAILLQYAAPVYVLALSPWLLKEPLRRPDVLAIVAILGGMALIFPAGGLTGSRCLFGNVMGVLSGFTFAGCMIALRKWRDGSGVLGLALGNLLTALVALPIAALRRPGWVWPDVSSGSQILFLGAVQIGLAYFLFQRGVHSVRAAEASILILVEPVACPLWAYLVIDDRPTAATLAGGGVILATLAVHALATLRAARAARRRRARHLRR